MINFKSLSIICLGDSYTIGEGIPEIDRWPNQLARFLLENGLSIDKPDIVAQTGWTTAELLNVLDEQTYQPVYDVATLLIGVNNQYRKQPESLYHTEFPALLAHAVKYVGNVPGRVFVLSIPDWGCSPFAASHDDVQEIAREIDALNAFARQECDRQQITFIDITTLSREASREPGTFAEDGLHYSGLHMQRWVEGLFPYVTKIPGLGITVG